MSRMHFQKWWVAWIGIMATAGCGTSTGNPGVMIQFASWNGATPFASAGQQHHALIVGDRGISDLQLCLKRLRLKSGDGPEEFETDFNLGLIAVSPKGTSLGEVQALNVQVDEIRFELVPKCAPVRDVEGPPSIAFKNRHGAFVSYERHSLRFRGSYGFFSGATLNLKLQQIVDALAEVRTEAELRVALERVSGE